MKTGTKARRHGGTEARRKTAKDAGPYVVEPRSVTTDKGQLLEGFRIRGPQFAGFELFGHDGQSMLVTLAARMNLAFEAGFDLGRYDAKRQRKSPASPSCLRASVPSCLDSSPSSLDSSTAMRNRKKVRG